MTSDVPSGEPNAAFFTHVGVTPEDRAHLVFCDPQTIGVLIGAWFERHSRPCPCYQDPDSTRIRNAALQEAAKVADTIGADILDNEGLSPLDTSMAISARILALKTPERQDG